MIRLFHLSEAVAALILAWALVFGLPLRWTGRLFGDFASPSPAPEHGPHSLPRARAVARRVSRLADRLPWHSTCLVRAVACALLLTRRRIAGARIRFGVRRQDGALAAHAWVLLGEEILLGGNEAGDFVPLADLG